MNIIKADCEYLLNKKQMIEIQHMYIILWENCKVNKKRRVIIE